MSFTKSSIQVELIWATPLGGRKNLAQEILRHRQGMGRMDRRLEYALQ